MDNSLIYTVIEKDFENSVIVEGVVEPTYFTTVMCPANVDGTIIYMVEDGTQVKEGDVICIIEDNNNETNYNNLLDLIESISAELSTKKS